MKCLKLRHALHEQGGGDGPVPGVGGLAHIHGQAHGETHFMLNLYHFILICRLARVHSIWIEKQIKLTKFGWLIFTTNEQLSILVEKDPY